MGNSFGTRQTLNIDNQELSYHSLPALENHERTKGKAKRLPRSLKILLENLLRHEDGDIVHSRDIEALLAWDGKVTSNSEIQFTPARVLLQDFTGVPVVADLAAMRSALERKGRDPSRVNPLQPVDLVIDHSVQVDAYGSKEAFRINAEFDFARNGERYEFLKWGQQAFRNFRVVPPATGICHQVNLESLAHVAMTSSKGNETWVYPDTLVGTDSHTTMINGLGVLGWGVGGIEAEAAMLGQPCSMLIPDVVGFELSGHLAPGVTATDLVLTLTQMLRKRGVVGKFVEFMGPGVTALSIADRATISNMAPEYGATVGYWPIDSKTVDYLVLTGRPEQGARTEAYYRAQGLWADDESTKLEFSDHMSLDLATVEPSLAGPAKPHDRSALSKVRDSFNGFAKTQAPANASVPAGVLKEGSIVIAAITSCTNTSNPVLMLGAAVLARNAVRKGLKVPSYVKTSFAPGSQAVTGYIGEAGLQGDLDQLGFNLVGYGCTTCIGNAGPLPGPVSEEIEKRGLTVAAVLLGNRNFEARIHPQVRANYLASPPLVIAFALAGRIDIDLTTEPLGVGSDQKPVFLSDIWPDHDEIQKLALAHVTRKQFTDSYAGVFTGGKDWRELPSSEVASYTWKNTSTYIKRPPFLDPEFSRPGASREPINKARLLGIFGDFITTDHISPAGGISPKSPAGLYLSALGVKREDYNSYGARRGNHEIMMRGTFANVRLRNLMVEREGGYTRHWPSGTEMSIFDAAELYRQTAQPLVIFAGREYGSGSSRDWAAKGTRLLGVRAVVASSFERIHRSNLVGMGVLPLELEDGVTTASLNLKGDEEVSITGLEKLAPKSHLEVQIKSATGTRTIKVTARVDTPNELRYLDAGGILPYVLERL